MKEIELRLALVFYGGVSLAIYMHGVSREILNLVRASSVRLDRKSNGSAQEAPDQELPPVQSAYKDLLDLLSSVADIRVVVDAIAGASAGGVNGIMLARAITHDLPLDSHSEMWLENADVTRLARPQAGLSRYLKISISPVLDQLISTRLTKQIESAETREKLRLFMQARWFTPPFSGERFIGWMLDACQKMEDGAVPGRSLIPRGQTLDLFVTITDYNGIKRRIHLDDPDYVEEWDHRRILSFHAAHRMPGDIESQFDADSIPEIVFAARATSSFPGAFPPATVAEMERVLVDHDLTWHNRDAFLARGLNLTSETAGQHCFVDGSVVMNKPFAPVIDVIQDRPAVREVARRLIYVDPSPVVPVETDSTVSELPGFFRVILASLAHIPRNEPIGDDLKELEQNNRRSRWLSQLIDDAGPMVEKAVAGILPKRRRVTPDILSLCRKQATVAAFEQAGFAFLNYQSLKLHSLAERLAGLTARLSGLDSARGQEEALLGLYSRHTSRLTAESKDILGRTDPHVVALLRGLDVDYRIRRLRFAVRKLNGFYHYRPGSDLPPPNFEALDQMKGLLYEQIDHLGWRWNDRFFGGRSRELAETFVRAAEAGGPDAAEHVQPMLKSLTQMMGLADLDRLQDELFAETARNLLDKSRHTSLMGTYIGFGFFDLITFPVLQRNDFSEVTEILVDRISPTDAASLYTEGFDLKGKSLNTFGAFFNRSWREHDYLWGRLNAADRLVSIVLSAAGEGTLPQIQVNQARARIFLAVLEEERGKLSDIPEEIDRVDKLVRSIYPDFAHVTESV
ncbi:Patatin-like phospholipase [Labrenzia sp. THAF191b]|uniref:patatin-like protein n=1 Tax=unclassified Labrenzia TaxID=2648686 RepID=UPI001267D555|nr:MULTISPECIES: patatin-like protein [unclassified Labrenzia]QFS99518.1 Patatin-like phospholipase [Labrenzia sp. THAF191b]QFT05832.1 Patatin-like phospholipase [Labrenzia sp. THAF191a]QFT17376.1 Patatin-like phospholipase [Labrenzia sp. THAF187b]